MHAGKDRTPRFTAGVARSPRRLSRSRPGTVDAGPRIVATQRRRRAHGHDGHDRRQRDVHLRGQRGLGAAARRLDDAGGVGDGGLRGPRLLLQPLERASGRRLRPRRKLSPLVGRRPVRVSAHDPRRRARQPVARRPRSRADAVLHPDGRAARARSAPRATARTPGSIRRFQLERLQERHARRRPVQPADRHRPDAVRRDVRHRRLRQRPRAQVRRRRHASPVLGRARHGARPVQPAARRVDRPTRARARGRPRERPRAGVRPGGQAPAHLADEADRPGGVLRGRPTTSSTSSSTTAGWSAC